MSMQCVIVIAVDQTAHPVIPILDSAFVCKMLLEEDVPCVPMATMAMVACWDVCPVTVIQKVPKALSVTRLVSVSADVV